MSARTRASAAANGVADRVDAQQLDGLEGVPDASARLILLNPPFHLGATVHTGIAERLIAEERIPTLLLAVSARRGRVAAVDRALKAIGPSRRPR